MNRSPVASLHSAARQYLIGHASIWTEKYSGRGPWTGSYSAWDYDTFPRYQVLFAILEDVERHVPEDFQSFEDGRTRLSDLGLTAGSLFTSGMESEIGRKAMAEEREAYVRFVQGQTPESASSFDDLPYRRVLGDAEVDDLLARIKERWGSSPWYWFPSSDYGHLLTLRASAFHDAVRSTDLRQLMQSLKTTRVFEVRESGASYELDIEMVDVMYDGAEGYWVSDPADWAMYASHEGTVTLAGEALVRPFASAWPEWKQWVWK